MVMLQVATRELVDAWNHEVTTQPHAMGKDGTHNQSSNGRAINYVHVKSSLINGCGSM